MKEYLVFIKDCLSRLCDRLRNEYHEQAVQDIRRTMSKCFLLVCCSLISPAHCMIQTTSCLTSWARSDLPSLSG